MQSLGDATNWRQSFLTEYMSVGTYFNDHSSAWQDGQNTTVKCGGPMPTGPSGKVPKGKCVESQGVSDGNCYFVDSVHSNSWRALRIINDQEDLQYVEYDPTWRWNTTSPSGAGLQHYELYDLSKDPYQMTNIYKQADESTKTRLHTEIAAYYACKGDSTTASTCP